MLGGDTKKASGPNWLDITLLFILFMLWFFIGQVWKDNLVGYMLTITGLMISIYVISSFTGFLSWIKLTVPTWTISAFISVLVWKFYLSIIPIKGGVSSTLTESISEGILTQIFNPDNIIRLLQIVLFVSTESLLMIVLFALFRGVSTRYKKNLNPQQLRKASIAPLIIIGGFGGLIHTQIANQLAQAGVIDFQISLWQQFLSFFIFGFTAIVFGAPGLITSHWIKNMIIYGTLPWWYGSFIFFVLMDIASLTIQGKSVQDITKQKLFT